MSAPDRDDDDALPPEDGAGEPPLAHEAMEPEDEGGTALPHEKIVEVDERTVEPHPDATAAQELADYETRLSFAEALAHAESELPPEVEADAEAEAEGDETGAEETTEPGEPAAPDAFVDADPGALDAAAGIAANPDEPADERLDEAEAAAAEREKVDVVRRHLRGLLEALLFIAERPMKAADLAEVARAEIKEVRAILEELSDEYRASARGFLLDELAGGWQLRTSPTFAPFVREMTQQKPVKLTRAQVETLAIIAYRQPITRPEVEEIRGVDAGAVMKLLLDRDMIRVLGKKDEPGRPLLYGTTTHFLTFFGLKSLRDLPTLREFTELTEESREVVERELGEVLPEGPKETVQVGDANVAAADVDPFADSEPNAEPHAHTAVSASEPGHSVPPQPEPQPGPHPEWEPQPEPEPNAPPEWQPEPHVPTPEPRPEPETPPKPEPIRDEDSENDHADEEDEPADEGERAGGSKYDPSDEELFPDDDDEDFDEDDEEEDDEDEDESDDEDE